MKKILTNAATGFFVGALARGLIFLLKGLPLDYLYVAIWGMTAALVFFLLSLIQKTIEIRQPNQIGE